MTVNNFINNVSDKRLKKYLERQYTKGNSNKELNREIFLMENNIREDRYNKDYKRQQLKEWRNRTGKW